MDLRHQFTSRSRSSVLMMCRMLSFDCFMNETRLKIVNTKNSEERVARATSYGRGVHNEHVNTWRNVSLACITRRVDRIVAIVTRDLLTIS